MPKLGLVKFCQPDDSSKAGYWFRLLGSSQVTFAVCDADGWVLLAVDLEAERPRSRRSKRVKQSVLAACRIKHLIVTRGPLPALTELRALIPSGAPGNAQVATPPSQSLDVAWATLANTEVFQDSFFTQSGMVNDAEHVDSINNAPEVASDTSRKSAAPPDALTMRA